MNWRMTVEAYQDFDLEPAEVEFYLTTPTAPLTLCRLFSASLSVTSSSNSSKMSMDSQRPLQNGHARSESDRADEIAKLNQQLTSAMYLSGFHGDALIGVSRFLRISTAMLNFDRTSRS